MIARTKSVLLASGIIMFITAIIIAIAYVLATAREAIDTEKETGLMNTLLGCEGGWFAG